MINKIKAVKGVDAIYYALIKTIGEDGTPTYDVPVRLKGAKELSFKPVYKTGDFFEDMALALSVNDLSYLDVSFNVTDVAEENMVKLFGYKEAEGGGYLTSAIDTQPDIALLFRLQLGDGTYRYTVFYNGQLIPGDVSYKNSDDKVEFSTKILSGKFKPITADSKIISYTVDGDVDLSTEFFSTVTVKKEKVILV